ncbi:MAG: hypothetical protein HXS48_04095 [Theionarchaea archaeon]|nr:hypothetical protein [Theionarchaea archaeon]
MKEVNVVSNHLWSALQENAALMVMYILGAVLFTFVWWPLGLIYLGY